MIVQSAFGAASLYAAAGTPAVPRPVAASADPGTANSAEPVSISAAARERLAGEQRAAAASSSPTSFVAAFDTNQGTVNLDVESYLTGKSWSGTGEIPPLLMPTQRNIDALGQYVSSNMPGLLAAHGIPYAPARIGFDTQGQIQFPSDYPYGAQLKEALQQSPAMERALGWSQGLSESKAALDEAVGFQAEYRGAASPQELQAVIAKYGSLLSGNRPSAQVLLNFSAAGQLSITVNGNPQRA